MPNYQLGFISDENLFNALKDAMRVCLDYYDLREADKGFIDLIKFHRNLFGYVGRGWNAADVEFDVVNAGEHIYADLRNVDRMTSEASRKIYIKMQHRLLRDRQAVCLLVDLFAETSQDLKWNMRVDGETISHERIRRVSIDKFYEIVFKDEKAFFTLCQALPANLRAPDALSLGEDTIYPLRPR